MQRVQQLAFLEIPNATTVSTQLRDIQPLSDDIHREVIKASRYPSERNFQLQLERHQSGRSVAGRVRCDDDHDKDLKHYGSKHF